jgi:hypothetical protein
MEIHMLKKAKRPQDWGTREKHHLYGLWGWHKDRNKYGMVSEWSDDFWVFASGVGDRPSDNHRLRRKEITEPMGPDNFFWDIKYAIGGNAKNTLAQRAEYMREYRKRRPRNIKDTVLKKHYGIDSDAWEGMYEEQGGVCAICKQSESEKSQRYVNLAVDHCHTTKVVRGLLCNACNRALGFFKDDIERLRSATRYLEKFY